MPAKVNVPANPEVRLTAVMIGAARGDDKEEWESDSCAIFHISHARAEMTAHKKASWGGLSRSLMGSFCR